MGRCSRADLVAVEVTVEVRLHPQAETELAEAVQWYEDRSEGLGVALATNFESTVAAIVHNPLAYPKVARALRRAVMRRFPYNVLYSIHENEIRIIALYHGRRDPKGWLDRTL